MLSSRFDWDSCVIVRNLVIEMPVKGTELRANSDLTRVGGRVEAKDLATFF
jgi:hypothetical protein